MNIPANWTFKNEEVASGFDRHVREQLPWYEHVTGLMAHCGRHYIPHGGLVYDIGASTGNVGRALGEVLTTRSARLTAIEDSAEIAARYEGGGEIVIADALEYPFVPFDFAVLHLVLMFMPVASRADWLGGMVGKIRPGGAIFITDRTEPISGYLATVMWRATLAGKMATGTSAADIVAKELSLAGVQRPLSPSELPPSAQEIFRFGDFAAWVIEGPKP